MTPLAVLLALGLMVNLGLVLHGLFVLRQDQRRERRQRAVVHELNARRWYFVDQIAATGGGSRVPGRERWGRAA